MSARASRVRLVVLPLAAVLVLTATSAQANDPATAQALFDQARKLMTQERWGEACPKLEESQKLDPGGGTLLHLALCREHEGRTATAWAHYQDALSQAKRDGRKDRAKIAQDRINALAPRLPKMRVKIASSNRSLPGFKVMRNDALVGEAQWNEPVPVDPRSHVITAQADGYKAWTTKVDVPSTGSETVIDVPELEVDPHAGDAEREKREKREKEERERAERERQEALKLRKDEGSGQRMIGLIVGGVGVAGLAVGSVFGLISMSKGNEADRECRENDKTLCNSKGVEAGDAAITAGNVSTISFIAGGALVVGGAVLYFTAPDGTTVGVRANPARNGAGLSLTGTF